MNTYNNITIEQIMRDCGHEIAKAGRGCNWYLSPFHDEKTASFKENTNENTWYDFSEVMGGGSIKLFQKLYNIPSFSQAEKAFTEKYNLGNSISFELIKPAPAKEKTPQNNIVIRSVNTLNNPALLNYLAERKISAKIAQEYVQEMHFHFTDTPEKPQFAMCFQNDKGNYELRNKYLKSCTGKDITTIGYEPKGDNVVIFEGFMDFLSFLQVRDKIAVPKGEEYIILNSCSQTQKAIEYIKSRGFKNKYIFLDNDPTGMKVKKEFTQVFGMKAFDMSYYYKSCNDLNQALQDNKLYTPKHRLCQ